MYFCVLQLLYGFLIVKFLSIFLEIMSKKFISFVNIFFSKSSFVILFPSSSRVKTFEFADTTHMRIQPQRIMNASF